MDSKEKITKLTKDMKFLASRIKDNNKFLQEHKLDVVEFTPPTKKGKKAQIITPAPQAYVEINYNEL